jgi:hypothetical protein
MLGLGNVMTSAGSFAELLHHGLGNPDLGKQRPDPGQGSNAMQVQ